MAAVWYRPDAVRLSAHEVTAWRRYLGLDATGRAIVDRAGLERLDAALDRRAGRYRLSARERFVIRCCRVRFGLYDPTAGYQARFIGHMNRLPRLVGSIAEYGATAIVRGR